MALYYHHLPVANGNKGLSVERRLPFGDQFTRCGRFHLLNQYQQPGFSLTIAAAYAVNGRSICSSPPMLDGKSLFVYYYWISHYARTMTCNCDPFETTAMFTSIEHLMVSL